MRNRITDTLRRKMLRFGWRVADFFRKVKKAMKVPIEKIREYKKRRQATRENQIIEAKVKTLKENFIATLNDQNFKRRINEEIQMLAEQGNALKQTTNKTAHDFDPLAIEAYKLSINRLEKPTQEEQLKIKKEIEELRKKIAIRLFLEGKQIPLQVRERFLQELEKN